VAVERKHGGSCGRGGGVGGDCSFLLSSVSLLNPFSVFRCSLSRFCSSSSSSVLLALAALMVAGWWWQLLGSPMTAAVLLLRGAATLTSVSSSSGLSFPRPLSAPLFFFPSFLYSPVLPFHFLFFLFKFAGGGVCFSLNLSSLSTSPLFFLPSSFYFRSLALPWCLTPSVSPLFLSNNCRSLSRFLLPFSFKKIFSSSPSSVLPQFFLFSTTQNTQPSFVFSPSSFLFPSFYL